jgi:hypothetical protein
LPAWSLLIVATNIQEDIYVCIFRATFGFRLIAIIQRSVNFHLARRTMAALAVIGIPLFVLHSVDNFTAQ